MTIDLVTRRFASIAAFAVCLVALDASAATITGLGTTIFPGASTGAIGPVGSTPAPNNDNATSASPNVILYSIFFNSLGTLDVEFIAANSGGTTEYLVPQSLVNNSGQTWTDFHLELGFGVGTAFIRSGDTDGLDFDTPDRDPAPTSSVFTVLDHQPDTLDWSGGSVPSIGGVAFALAIDVPDNLSTFHPGALNAFTLRQFPTTASVSEPGTMLLSTLALGGLVARSAVSRLRARRA
jgi:hypothetical protein